jgi:hypothetical protein
MSCSTSAAHLLLTINHPQIFNAKTGKVAIFNHVFLWGWGSPRDTGNFVPKGCVVPDGLPETRMYAFHAFLDKLPTETKLSQRIPSNLCEFSYAFNVTDDKAIFEAITVSIS